MWDQIEILLCCWVRLNISFLFLKFQITKNMPRLVHMMPKWRTTNASFDVDVLVEAKIVEFLCHNAFADNYKILVGKIVCFFVEKFLPKCFSKLWKK